jgi:hypothetical protein
MENPRKILRAGGRIISLGVVTAVALLGADELVRQAEILNCKTLFLEERAAALRLFEENKDDLFGGLVVMCTDILHF